MSVSERPNLKKLGALKRRPVSLSGEEMVRVGSLPDGGDLPLLVEARMEGVDLPTWAGGNRGLVEEKLRHHGGILFRGFKVQQPADLERFIQSVSGESLEYRERSSPRSSVEGNIYTSTDYPANQPIFLHNENSYQAAWPKKIFFFCYIQPGSGGETPIADVRRVYQRIDPAVRERFAEQGWMYVRNFGEGFGLEWQTVFQTEDRQQVERHCERSGIRCEWRDGGRLRTTAVRPAVAVHPDTGEWTWFNHATFFHVTTLDPVIQAALRNEFADEDLPTNTYYGDGSPIEAETLEHLRAAYEAETVRFPWRRGDVLLLDNMLVAHGRAPFSGERKVLVGMAEPVTRADLAAAARG